jgi:hypothetical protein
VTAIDRQLIRCRAFLHAWDEGVTDLRYKRPPTGHSQPARCERCGSFRFQWLGWDGRPVATWYELTEAYRKIATAMTRGEAKVWLIEHPQRQRRTDTA